MKRTPYRTLTIDADATDHYPVTIGERTETSERLGVYSVLELSRAARAAIASGASTAMNAVKVTAGGGPALSACRRQPTVRELSPAEQVAARGDGADDTGDVGGQRRGERVANSPDLHGAVVDGEHIESCFRRSLERADEIAGVAVRTDGRVLESSPPERRKRQSRTAVASGPSVARHPAGRTPRLSATRSRR